jgi:DNA polymerase-3 subunit gamma/tau
MSYLVMARKWRPKNFEEMVGQEHIAQTLRNAIASGRVSHAYLFTGTRGVGKTTSARILAKALNCKNGPTATPCEVCENCVSVTNGSSMDVLEIDGASNNGVENIRDLREQVKYAPMQGQYKIYIIDEVHMLSKAAFNALLKTLEEPPPHVVFIFATTESGKVPHTILSRVQRFDFKRISEAGIRERLEFICGKEGITPEIEALEAIARKADGSMRDALSLFDRVYAFAGSSLTLDLARKALGIPEERLFDDLLKHVSAHNAGGAFTVLDEVYGQGLEVSEFLSGFGEYLRDLLFSRQPGITPALLGRGESRFAELRALAGDLQDGDILRYAKIVSDLLGALKTAPHPRLGIELGLARMAALDRVVTLSQLMGQDVPLPAGAAPYVAPAAPAASSSSDAEEKKKSPELGTRPIPSLTTAPTARAPWDEVPPAPVPAPEAPPEFLPPLPEEEPGLVEHFESEIPAAHAHPERAQAHEHEGLSGYAPAAIEPEPDGGPGHERGPDANGLVVHDAPKAWASLVEDYAQDKPFTAGPLRHSRLCVSVERPGEPPLLEVVFSGPHQHDLFLADSDNRKSLSAFLTLRFAPGSAFGLSYRVEESGDGVDISIHPPESPQAMLQREPILQTLVNLFEGRILN